MNKYHYICYFPKKINKKIGSLDNFLVPSSSHIHSHIHTRIQVCTYTQVCTNLSHFLHLETEGNLFQLHIKKFCFSDLYCQSSTINLHIKTKRVSSNV